MLEVLEFQDHVSDEKSAKCEKVFELFSIFSNKIRFQILCLLKQGDFCVQEIVNSLGAKYSNVSQQLKILTLAGYLSRVKKEKQVFYHLKNDKIKEILKFLESIF